MGRLHIQEMTLDWALRKAHAVVLAERLKEPQNQEVCFESRNKEVHFEITVRFFRVLEVLGGSVEFTGRDIEVVPHDVVKHFELHVRYELEGLSRSYCQQVYRGLTEWPAGPCLLFLAYPIERAPKGVGREAFLERFRGLFPLIGAETVQRRTDIEECLEHMRHM